MNPTYTIEQIEAIAATLRDLPPVDHSEQVYSMHEAT